MKQFLLKCTRTVFCVVFFCLLAVFSVGMLIPGASNAVEGAAMPALVTDGKISDGFGNDFETWFSKRFAFRGKVVDAFSALKETVFHTGNDQVIVGEDDFLFFADTLDSYTHANPLTEDEIVAIAHSLSNLQDYAETHGARFLFVCAPNKNTIYGEFMPARYEQQNELSDLDRLYAYLGEKTDVRYLDVRPALLAAKEDGTLLYHKRDSHWNGIGAHIAFTAIAEHLALSIPDFTRFQIQETDRFEGDLDRLLYPGSVKYDDDTVIDLEGQFMYTSAFTTSMDMEITTRSAGKSGKLLMFRDSFASAWMEQFAATFSDCRFERAIPYRIDGAANGNYDVILVEIVERNLRSLIGADERIQNP